MKRNLILILLGVSFSAFAQNDALKAKASQSADQIEDKVIAWLSLIHI